MIASQIDTTSRVSFLYDLAEFVEHVANFQEYGKEYIATNKVAAKCREIAKELQGA